MERIEISREKTSIGAGSIETPKLLRINEVLSRVYPHTGTNGKPHSGNMKVVDITDPVGLGFIAKIVCVQPGCGVEAEIEVKSSS
jgi:hypothetical protein